MEEQEIIDNNKLIAEFMGWVFNTSFTGLLPDHWVDETSQTITSYHDTNLKFHSSWDWLMPVVEKIELMKHPTYISSNNCKVYENVRWADLSGFEIDQYGKTKLEAVYNACIKFIEWYNEYKITKK